MAGVSDPGNTMAKAGRWAYCTRLFFGKIDQDDNRVLAQAIEHDLLTVACDVEGPHGGAGLKPGEWARPHGSEIEQPEIL